MYLGTEVETNKGILSKDQSSPVSYTRKNSETIHNTLTGGRFHRTQGEGYFRVVQRLRRECGGSRRRESERTESEKRDPREHFVLSFPNIIVYKLIHT